MRSRIHDLDPAAQISKEIGLGYYSAESRKRIEPALQEAVQHGKWTPYDLELEITTAAHPQWVRTIGHPITEQGGRSCGYRVIPRHHGANATGLKLQYAVTLVLAEGASLERTSQKIIETLGEGLGWDLGELWPTGPLFEIPHPPSTELRFFADASA